VVTPTWIFPTRAVAGITVGELILAASGLSSPQQGKTPAIYTQQTIAAPQMALSLKDVFMNRKYTRIEGRHPKLCQVQLRDCPVFAPIHPLGCRQLGIIQPSANPFIQTFGQKDDKEGSKDYFT
jgi:hypothetical protein